MAHLLLTIAVIRADVFLPPGLSPTQDELDDIGKGWDDRLLKPLYKW